MAGLSEPVAQTSLFGTEEEEDLLAQTLDGLQAQFGGDAIMKGFAWERAHVGIGRNRHRFHHGDGGPQEDGLKDSE